MTRTRLIPRLLVAACALFVCAGAIAQQTGVIRDIVVKGAQNVNREQILAVMRSKVGQPFLQPQLDQDKQSIEDLGFFQAVDVRARELEPQFYEVTVEVNEFARVKEIRVVGNTVVTTEAILKALETSGIVVGNLYNLRSQSSASQAVTKLYNEKGYFAQISEFGPLPESPETISVVIAELTVNSIAIQGNTRTRTGVFDRMIKTEAGDAFNQGLWQEDMRRLYNTQWFEKIEPVAKPTDELGKIDLIVDVKEARTGMFNVGLQVDPRSSFAGFLSFSDSNFRGSGQSLGTTVSIGSAGGGPSGEIDYANPFIDHRDTALSASVYSRIVYRFGNSLFGGSSSPTDDRFYERRTGFRLNLSRPLNRRTSVVTGLKLESSKTSDLDTKSTTGFIQQDGEVGTLTLGLVRNNRDTDIDPSRGDWLKVQAEPGFANIRKVGGDGGDDSLLGTHGFLRGGIDYRVYWSDQGPRKKLDDPRRVIAFRARAGAITGTVPFFEQFFVGGSDTLRGYDEDRFWGKQFAAFTVEYRLPIQKSFTVAFFADYGSAWGGYGTVNRFTQSNTPNFKLGAGIGFSFRSPLGPIRLDFAFNEDGRSRTHFLIGTSF